MDLSSIFEDLGTFVQEFDPSAMMPDLDSMLGKVELVVRIAVLLAPVVLLALGLWYFLMPPKEANHMAGYRFYWGMGSVEAWRFTQKTAGIAWGLLGLGMTIAMALLCNGLRGMEVMEMVWTAVEYILWEFGLVVISCLVIDLTVLLAYNRKGDLRKIWRKKK